MIFASHVNQQQEVADLRTNLNGAVNFEKKLKSDLEDQSFIHDQSIFIEQSVSPVKSINQPHTIMSNTVQNMSKITQKHDQTGPYFQPAHDNVQPHHQIQSVQSVSSVKSRKSFKTKCVSFKKHRRGKRNSVKLFSQTFKWVGNNIAGTKSKLASVKRLIRSKIPSILSLQETKFQIAGKHNFDGYFSYEHLRSEKTAGGDFLWQLKRN